MNNLYSFLSTSSSPVHCGHHSKPGRQRRKSHRAEEDRGHSRPKLSYCEAGFCGHEDRESRHYDRQRCSHGRGEKSVRKPCWPHCHSAPSDWLLNSNECFNPLQEMMKEAVVCEPAAMDSEDILFLLYTSGSTGKPKGLVHTQAGYLLYAALTHRVRL